MAEEEKIDLSIFMEDYLSDSREGFRKAEDALLSLEKDYKDPVPLDQLGRTLHTLKSSSAMLNFTDISEVAHAAEGLLTRLRDGDLAVTRESTDLLFEVVDMLEEMVYGKSAEKGREQKDYSRQIAELKTRLEAKGDLAQGEPAGTKAVAERVLPVIEKLETVKVDVHLLDMLFNLVGEIMITRNRIATAVAGYESKPLRSSLADFDRMIASLRDSVTRARLIVADEIFQKFPRLVRNLAKEEGKEIDLVIEGREIEMDKAVIEAIGEPLMHLLRNAVDHGIEPSDERSRKGKKLRGTIRLAARRTENNIVIEVEDDGRGIDIERIRGAAVKKGFLRPDQAGAADERELIELLFTQGFSSSDLVTGISGRGIGLNVVKTVARELGGMVEVMTEKDKGARFSTTLPLTTAVIRTLLVEAGGQTYAIPSSMVSETMRVSTRDIKMIGGGEALIKDGEVLPLVRLNSALGFSFREQKELFVIIVKRGENFMGIGVDMVIDQTDSIVKPLDPLARRVQGISGGTILGDGRVVLFLDIPSLLNFKTIQGESYAI